MSAPAANERAFYSPKEVADLCDADYELVLSMIKDGDIPSVRFGARSKVPASWVRQHVGETAPALTVVPDPEPPAAPDFTPLASVLDLLGKALVAAAAELRSAS
jgi:excisionase family DNA binding protein